MLCAVSLRIECGRRNKHAYRILEVSTLTLSQLNKCWTWKLEQFICKWANNSLLILWTLILIFDCLIFFWLWLFYAKIFLQDPAVSYSEFNLRSRHSKKDNFVLTESLLGISNIFIPLSLHSYSQSWLSPLLYFVSQRISYFLQPPLK